MSRAVYTYMYKENSIMHIVSLSRRHIMNGDQEEDRSFYCLIQISIGIALDHCDTVQLEIFTSLRR